MTRKQSVTKRTASVPSSAITLQPRPASVESTELRALEERIIEELAPQGALQRSVAENIARNEVEIRTLGARKALLFWGAAAREMGALLFLHLDQRDAEACAADWAAGCPKAATQIAALDIDPEHALNAAFILTAPVSGMIETQIQRLEHRRRQLHADLRQLQTMPRATSAIEDAEVLNDAG
jgi:hypothetical protein